MTSTTRLPRRQRRILTEALSQLILPANLGMSAVDQQEAARSSTTTSFQDLKLPASHSTLPSSLRPFTTAWVALKLMRGAASTTQKRRSFQACTLQVKLPEVF